ncbi:2-oxo-4-hydroxy-4-carboxy-5-ureidoimidazoline decarboxylase [Actinoallomurus bryophytorum]|uniref:2-oxo-4-hydroxy-4-carboxy-5-ureidoimidazoline decarboxylase n=1 Tax=Actinoallomurus bryophytorum TaxID=1490222 RepID=A0A543C0M4_9ACTN|nr:2-oxo-4-hydroxy-4-carboxy-5-ureidoimidazoline decarboxylase [Actinoallomurus bryophytorum]TQL90608.1 2-oxo-4-hydroxy-4-carboxy-5-ureidoimidazoline decarboxylase [Actinoallomurus bryophytorum]
MRFNALSRAQAEAELLTCCASRRWAADVAAGRPYGSAEDLFAAAVTAVRALEWPDVEEALNAHPRIGDRPPGGDRASAWSRGEQSGVGDADRAAFAEGNAAYETRFGHVFLICASGRGAGEMLADLRERLTNDPETERTVVHRELAEITELRLRKLMA